MAGAVGLCAAAIFAAAPARAQVIEVQPDGAATIFSGPVVSSGDGRRTLLSTNVPARPSPVRRDTTPVSEVIRDASGHWQVSERLLEAVAWQESRMNQRAVSPKGARGVMQLMPGTARRLGVDAGDLRGNVEGGAAYLSRLLQEFDGDLVKALAAYNAGPAAVRRYNGVPPYPETRAYVAAILNRLAQDPTIQTAVQSSPRPGTR